MANVSEAFEQNLRERKPKLMDDMQNAFYKRLTALIRNMRIVFPNDTGLKTLQDTIEPVVRSKSNSILILFAKQLMAETSDGTTVADLILQMDERILTDPVMSIPILRSINIADKWPKLNIRNQAVVWGMLKDMTIHSQQYTILMSASPRDMLQLTMGVMSNQHDSPETQESLRKIMNAMAQTPAK